MDFRAQSEPFSLNEYFPAVAETEMAVFAKDVAECRQPFRPDIRDHSFRDLMDVLVFPVLVLWRYRVCPEECHDDRYDFFGVEFVDRLEHFDFGFRVEAV